MLRFKTSFSGTIFKQNKYVVLIDQALLSVINFGSILLLAKTVAPDIFGSFVVLYSYYSFIYFFLTSIIATPLLVFLKKRWKQKEGTYLFSIMLAHFFLCTGLILPAYFFLSQQVEGVPFWYFFLMSFGITLFDLLKKFVFSSETVHIKYGLISTLLLNLVFFYGLFSAEYLDLSKILMIYWISFFLADLLLLYFLLKKGVFNSLFQNTFGELVVFFKKATTTHYQYAKWILLGGIAFWGYTQGIYILAKAVGVDNFTIGKVRTIQNLLGVFGILAISIENHYAPIFSERLKISNATRIFSLIRSAFAENYKKVLFLFALAIPVGLWFYHFLYGEKYGDGEIIFFIFLGVQFMVVAIKPFAVVLKSIEKTTVFFTSHMLGVIGMVLTLLGLVYFKGNHPLPIAIAVATAVFILVLVIYFWKEIRRR